MVFFIFIACCILSSFLCKSSTVLSIRGGAVPEASKIGGEYYEKFELDYGCQDKTRIAGALRGFIQTGKLAETKEKDPFLNWWNRYLENGGLSNDETSRIKPFHVRQQ